MGIVIAVSQLLLALTFLVAIHEWGHMFSAKRFGMRVEKFSIGMPPKVVGKQFGETEYQIGALPLGGFVKISGMVDESMDKEQMAEEPKEWEFRSKPAWQRLIVMLGGIIVNTIAGILIFVVTTYHYGETYLPASEVKYGVQVGEIGEEMGMQTGDVIIEVNGKKFERFSDIKSPDVLFNDNPTYTIERNGEQITINVSDELINKLDRGRKNFEFVMERYPYAIDAFSKNSNAKRAGFKIGDQIVKANGKDVFLFDQLKPVLQENKGKEVDFEVIRDGKSMNIACKVNEEGMIGFGPKSLLKTKTEYFSFGESISRGTKNAFGVFSNSIRAIKKILKGKADVTKTFSSPIAIGALYGPTWEWERFWKLTGMISMALAFMNLLPIPALDGGHVQFLLYEIITGRKPSDKFLEYAQMVGMFILLGLMLLLFGNDIWDIFKNWK